LIRVMVVDDHDFVRTTMTELIDATEDMRVVAEAENGLDAVPAARSADPEVVLMDLSMPGKNGIDTTRDLVAALPGVRVIVLTTSTRGQDVHDAAAAGAIGFLSKGDDPDSVLEAIRAAGKGGTAWDQRSTAILRHPD
jgi:DNA-binding NarL/FixJ family response regulator